MGTVPLINILICELQPDAAAALHALLGAVTPTHA